MRRRYSAGKGFPLVDSESVLLVRDDQGEIAVFHSFLYQSVRAYNDIGSSFLYPILCFALFLRLFHTLPLLLGHLL